MSASSARAGRLPLGLIAALAFIEMACAQPVPAARALPAAVPPSTIASISPLPVEAPPSDVADYLLSAGDVLQIQVLNAETFNRKVRVDAAGDVALPLLGNIHVAGLTTRAVETVIADLLREKFMNDPQVSAFVEEAASLRFSIEGAVRSANVFPLKGRVTLLQALAMSGGMTKVADPERVRVLRGAGANQQILVFDVEKIREGKLPDPVVLGNDAIIVEASMGKTVFYETLDTIRGLVSFGTLH